MRGKEVYLPFTFIGSLILLAMSGQHVFVAAVGFALTFEMAVAFSHSDRFN